jgi:DnaD/phage-associated family protein
MAEKRMFAKTIIDSDMFLDMSLSTQALYFHLAMRADDDGFINNPKRIQRMIGASDDEMKILIAKQYILPFDSGVVVIKHWKIHNYIQKDRYHPSTCPEKQLVELDTKTKMYERADTSCIQHCTQDCIQDVSVDKVRLDKNSIDKSRLVESRNEQTDELSSLIEFCNNNVEILTPFKMQMLEGYVDDYGIEWVQKGLEKLAGLDRTKQNVKYLGGVLNGWKKDGDPKPWEDSKEVKQAAKIMHDDVGEYELINGYKVYL